MNGSWYHGTGKGANIGFNYIGSGGSRRIWEILLDTWLRTVNQLGSFIYV